MLRMAYIDDAISGSAYDDAANLLSARSLSSLLTIAWDCNAAQDKIKRLLMIVGFCDD